MKISKLLCYAREKNVNAFSGKLIILLAFKQSLKV